MIELDKSLQVEAQAVTHLALDPTQAQEIRKM